MDGIASGRYSIRPIAWADRVPAMQWRNDQLVILRQQSPLTAEGQAAYYTSVVAPQFEQETPAQVLVAFLHDGALIGYGGLVHISWADARAEVSFITATERQAPEIFAADLSSFFVLAEELAGRMGLTRLTTEVYEFRQDYIREALAAGFVIEGRLPGHVRYEGGFVDSLLLGARLGDRPRPATLSS
jgi:RimJ/RimL family protein N-acetyltransferase